MPPEQDSLVQPADRYQHQAQAHERQRAVDTGQRRHVDQECLQDRKRDDGGRGKPGALRIEQNAYAEQDYAEREPCNGMVYCSKPVVSPLARTGP